MRRTGMIRKRLEVAEIQVLQSDNLKVRLTNEKIPSFNMGLYIRLGARVAQSV
jgi:hypothetical protein